MKNTKRLFLVLAISLLFISSVSAFSFWNWLTGKAISTCENNDPYCSPYLTCPIGNKCDCSEECGSNYCWGNDYYRTRQFTCQSRCAPIGEITSSENECCSGSEKGEYIGGVNVFVCREAEPCIPTIWYDQGECGCTPTQCEGCKGTKLQISDCKTPRSVECRKKAIGCEGDCVFGECKPTTPTTPTPEPCGGENQKCCTTGLLCQTGYSCSNNKCLKITYSCEIKEHQFCKSTQTCSGINMDPGSGTCPDNKICCKERIFPTCNEKCKRTPYLNEIPFDGGICTREKPNNICNGNLIRHYTGRDVRDISDCAHICWCYKDLDACEFGCEYGTCLEQKECYSNGDCENAAPYCWGDNVVKREIGYQFEVSPFTCHPNKAPDGKYSFDEDNCINDVNIAMGIGNVLDINGKNIGDVIIYKCHTTTTQSVTLQNCRSGLKVGQCSELKPLKCVHDAEGDFYAEIDDCNTCGCSEGYKCNTYSGSCFQEKKEDIKSCPYNCIEDDVCNEECATNERCTSDPDCEEPETSQLECPEGLPIGTRKQSYYCDIDRTMKPQKEESASCENNFECETNACIDSKCMSSGFLQKLIKWLTDFFGP